MEHEVTSRVRALTDLVEMRVPVDTSRERLSGLPWDSEELVDLEVRHVVAVLRSVADGSLDGAEATAWPG